VKALLAEKHTHHDLKLRLYQVVAEEGQSLPPIKVVCCRRHGGVVYSKDFMNFLHSRWQSSEIDRNYVRYDSRFIPTISEYGSFICDKFPFILDDMRTVHTWKLRDLLHNLLSKQKSLGALEFDPDLVAKAMSFTDQMSETKHCWKAFPKHSDSETNLGAFTEMHPDFWMAHHSMDRSYFGPTSFQVALRFAHILLQDSDTHYRVGPDEARDAMIYERIGISDAAGTTMVIEEVPALAHYSIDEYDGVESVVYGS